MSLKKVAQIATWTVASDWLPKAVALMAQLFLARHFGSVDFVVVVTATSWTTFAWTAADLGLASYGIRTVSLMPAGETRSNFVNQIRMTYIVTGLTASLGLAGFCIVTGYSAGLYCLAFIMGYALYPDWYLRATRNFKLLVLSSWSITIVQTFATALVFLWNVGPFIYLLVWGLSPVCGFFVASFGDRNLTIQIQGPWNKVPWIARVTLSNIKRSIPNAIAGIPPQAVAPLALSLTARDFPAPAAAAFAIGSRLSTVLLGAAWIAMLGMVPEASAATFRQILRTSLLSAALLFVPVSLLTTSNLFSRSIYIWLHIDSSQSKFLFLGLCALPIATAKSVWQLHLFAHKRDVQRLAINIFALLVVISVIWLQPSYATYLSLIFESLVFLLSVISGLKFEVSRKMGEIK